MKEYDRVEVKEKRVCNKMRGSRKWSKREENGDTSESSNIRWK